MAAVKGSKQHEMVVVPYRPYHKVVVFCVFLAFLSALSWLTYEYGRGEGLSMKVDVVREKDSIRRQLDETRLANAEMRREIADLRLGEEVDSMATFEVQQTVESLQARIAQLNEEITFYKGVMAPNVGDRGLRIERLNVENGTTPNRYRYSLLLTQVVDKHDYVQGGVEINFRGREGLTEREFSLNELDSSRGDDAIRFRFKYFQNIDGELTLPLGFEPTEVSIVAQSGNSGQRLERRFDWDLKGG